LFGGPYKSRTCERRRVTAAL